MDGQAKIGPSRKIIELQYRHGWELITGDIMLGVEGGMRLAQHMHMAMEMHGEAVMGQ